MISENYNNFMIYYNNLSAYYITCVLISIIAILFSWYFHFNNVPGKETKDESDSEQRGENEQSLSEETNKEKVDLILSETIPILRINTKEALDKITAGLTEEQLKVEKEVEHEQLSAILELLKNQEDKFQLGSMEELEGQLKLYR